MYSCMLKNLETIKKAYKTPGNHLICLEGKKGDWEIYRVAGIFR